MALQADKRQLNAQIARYMTLLSNLNKPPATYINDLDYMRGLVDMADEKEYRGLRQTWDTIRPTDTRSATYIETGKLPDNGRPAIKAKV